MTKSIRIWADLCDPERIDASRPAPPAGTGGGRRGSSAVTEERFYICASRQWAAGQLSL